MDWKKLGKGLEKIAEANKHNRHFKAYNSYQQMRKGYRNSGGCMLIIGGISGLLGIIILVVN